MGVEKLLLAALQSSFLLGLLHGINPCGHSWLVLAPFVAGERKGARVAVLTFSFLLGTALACLALGATLGAISQVMPSSMGIWVESITSLVLIVIGLLLLYNPHILHNHGHGHEDHCHDHECHSREHGHDDHGHRPNMTSRLKKLSEKKSFLPLALFAIGFVNMIVPCPTAAIMYGYALNSGHVLSATLVFAVYAVATAIAVGCVIFLIFKMTSMASSLRKDWVEPLIMRVAGAVIIIFSGYGLYVTAAA